MLRALPVAGTKWWRQATLGLALMTFLAMAPACGGDSDQPSAAPADEAVRGLIKEVKAASISELESLTLDGEDGTTWKFEASGQKFAEFTPSHLREHMVLGLPITVTFHREDGSLVVDDLSD